MAAELVSRFVKVVAINESDVLSISRITDDDTSTLNGHSVMKLDVGANANVDAIFQLLRVSVSSLISLNLSQCSLNYIPDALKDLKINELNLSHNSFKEVPGCIINGLKSLQILDISHNQLVYFPEPKCVKKLRVLHINNNALINIPEWILKLHSFNLEELNYSMNDMSTLDGERFCEVPTYELKSLILKNCSMRNVDLVHLKNIKSLTKLDLSNENNKRLFNCFTSCDVLFNKPRWDDHLKILYLNSLSMSDLPDEIGLLEALEEFSVKKNDLLWLPDSIVSLKNLRLLDLSFNKLVFVPTNFHKMLSLEILNVAHNALTKCDCLYPPMLDQLDLYDNLIELSTEFNFGHIKVDLEMNYVDTTRLSDKYKELKELLRINLDEARFDGQKEHLKDDDKSESSSDYSDIDNDDYSKRVPEDVFDDHWSSDAIVENGCTLSDSEWTGREERYISKTVKKPVRRYPSWIFEDVVIS